MAELKPCPFCGGKVEIVFYRGNTAVECPKCGCALNTWIGMTKEEATKAWNRRANK